MTQQFYAARLAGSSRTGSDKAGTVFHALPVGAYTALCGKTYGRRSAGWSDYHGNAVTCPRCLRKLAAVSDAQVITTHDYETVVILWDDSQDTWTVYTRYGDALRHVETFASFAEAKAKASTINGSP